MRKAIRAALYLCAMALVVTVAVLSPKQAALAQSSGGVSVPPAWTGHAIPIPPRDRSVAHSPSPVDHQLLAADPAALQKAKNAANDRAAASGQAGAAPSTTRPYSVFNGINFTGLTAAGCCTPSDSTGAVGPANYVETVNSSIQVRDRSGTIVSTLDLGMFGAFHPTDCVFDPQISWDQQAGHWLYSFLDQVPTTPGNCSTTITADYLNFGWSLTSDPSNLATGWCGFGINTSGDLADYDKLGHDNHFINIGANDFASSGAGAFRTAVIVSINKPADWSMCTVFPAFALFAGPNPSTPMLNADGSTAWTPVPADTADSSSVGYVVAAHNVGGGGASTKVMVWHVMANPDGTPNLVQDGDVTVTSYSMPPSVPQPITGATSCSTAGNCLDSLDGRITQAVAHFDPDAGKETVWAQHAVLDSVVGPRSVERWYELIPGAAAPRQAGNVSDAALYIFNGAISPTEAGNEAVMFYNAGNGSTTGWASFRAQSRNSATTLGMLTNETIITAGTVSTDDGSCGVHHASGFPCRWGDYSAARPDPNNQNVVWGTIMMTGTAGTGTTATWSTQVAAFTPGCATVNVSPPTLTAVDGSINTITATATGCSSPRYAFFLQYPDGTWTLQQAFSATNTWMWDSAGFPAGNFVIHVWAVQAGDSTASYEALGASTATLTVAAACTTSTVSPPTSAQQAGAIITFTTTAGGCPIPVFAYFVQDPTGTWTLVRPFSTDPTFAWHTFGLAPGHYTIHVWTNQRGHSTSTFEALGSATVTINICTAASLTPPTTTAALGTTVALTAHSTGCTMPQYEFFVQYPDMSWHLMQAWGGATFNWDTSVPSGTLVPGTYTVHVWANDIGDSTATYEALGSATVTLTGCTAGTVTPDKPSPSTIGTVVTFTATSSGCTAVYEFWLLDPSGTWTDKQAFSSMATWQWNTSGLAAGSYTIHVWVNAASASLATYEAIDSTAYTLTVPAPCTAAGVLPSSPTQPAGAVIAFTASSSTCTNPQYAVYVQFPDMSWHLVRGFGGASFSWDTTGLAPGAYLIHVWASATGSGHDSIGSSNVTLTGCTTASVTPAMQMAGAGTIVNMTGSGSPGCPNPQFEYWVLYPDMTWHLGRTWGPAAWGWDTTGFRPGGTYTIHAWANQTGASTATYEAIGSATVTLTGCTSATVAPATGSTTVGTPVTFTVTATTGCAAAIVYEFWVQYPDGTWHLGQAFSTTNSWTWTTTGLPKGNYVIHVWVNNQGSDTSTYETIGSATHTLT